MSRTDKVYASARRTARGVTPSVGARGRGDMDPRVAPLLLRLPHAMSGTDIAACTSSSTCHAMPGTDGVLACDVRY
eukprot:2121510-Rhodomonas_salina.4